MNDIACTHIHGFMDHVSPSMASTLKPRYIHEESYSCRGVYYAVWTGKTKECAGMFFGGRNELELQYGAKESDLMKGSMLRVWTNNYGSSDCFTS